MKTFTMAVAALALLLAPATALAADTDANVDAGRIAVVKEMIAAWKAADWRKVGDLFAEDGVLQSMMQEPVKGREAIYRRIAALGAGAPDGVILDVSHMGVIDGLVFIERVDRFTYKGKPGAVPVVGVLDVQGGKVKAWREYYDRAQLLKEMGVSEH